MFGPVAALLLTVAAQGLPPLDESLFADDVPGPEAQASSPAATPTWLAPAITPIAHLRWRGGVQSVGIDDRVSLGLLGRIGLDVDLDVARFVVVVGDGGDVVDTAALVSADPFASTAASAPLPRTPGGIDLVTSAGLPFVHVAEALVPLSLLGQSGVLRAGRRALTIADGGLVGAEPFDGRGRTLDGVSFAVTRDALAFEAGVGAFHLLAADVQQEGLLYAVVDVLTLKGDGHRASVTPPVPSIVAVSPWRSVGGNPGARDFVAVEGAGESTPAFDLSAYALLHAATKNRATIGARARGRGFGLEVVVAADGQSTVDSDDGGQLGAHLAVDVRTDLPWPKGSQAPRPWVGAGIESTFGDVGDGRALVAPGPTQHGRLTGLDVLRRDHTLVPRLWLGATDPTFGLQMDLRVSLLFGLGGSLADASGTPILAEETIARDLLQNDAGAALGTAVDVALIAPLWRGEAGSVGLEAAWSGVVGPVVPAGFAQQILVGLRFTTPTR